MSTINLTMNGQDIVAREGQTILDVALENDIHVPRLCYDPRVSPSGSCRLCVVEIEGERGLHTSCTRLAELACQPGGGLRHDSTQEGTVLHELTHFQQVGRTEDCCYTRRVCAEQAFQRGDLDTAEEEAMEALTLDALNARALRIVTLVTSLREKGFSHRAP